MSEKPSNQSAGSIAARLTNWTDKDTRAFVDSQAGKMSEYQDPLPADLRLKNLYSKSCNELPERDDYAIWVLEGAETCEEENPRTEHMYQAFQDTLEEFLGPGAAKELEFQLMTHLEEAPYDVSDLALEAASVQTQSELNTAVSNVAAVAPDDKDADSLKPDQDLDQ